MYNKRVGRTKGKTELTNNCTHKDQVISRLHGPW